MYLPSFSPPMPPVHSQTLPLTLQDPFDTSDISDAYYDAQSLPAYVEPSTPEPPSCSVCGARKGSLAVLEPCLHPLCSGCLTSALNIVGEKDMECAVCKAKVLDFKLQKVETIAAPAPQRPGVYPQAFGLSADSGIQDFFDRAQGVSTPVGRSMPAPSEGKSRKGDDKVVLRIDNVPWVSFFRIYTHWMKSLKSCRILLRLPSRLGLSIRSSGSTSSSIVRARL